MERYRIVKVPQIKGEPVFRIEIYVNETTSERPELITETKGWFQIDEFGKRMIYHKRRPCSQNRMCLFITQKEAEEKITSILNFNAESEEVVFDTLTANPPTETGT